VSRIFDHYLMVDWSANSTPKMGKDSIWLCVGNHVGPSAPENMSTRDQAVERIVEITRGCVEASGRVLVGFDFPFGYPNGFADKAWPVMKGQAWEKVWKGLLAEVKGDNQVGLRTFVWVDSLRN